MAGMSSGDCNELQVIQNSLNRLSTGARKGTPTKDLLKMTGTMSIMQMVAYHNLSMVHKVIQSGKLNMKLRWKGEPGEELLKPLITTRFYLLWCKFV